MPVWFVPSGAKRPDDGRRRLSVDMALRLARLFGTTERFWLNLQNEIDLRNRREELSGELEAIQPVTHDG